MTSILTPDLNVQLHAFLQTPDCSVYWKNVDGVFLGCNEAVSSSVGLDSPSQLIGNTDFDLPIRRSDANMYRKNDALVLKSQQTMRFQEFAIKNSIRTTYSTIKMPLYDDMKELAGILGMTWITHEEDTIESTLTARQEECLRYLAHGMTLKEIANATALSARTVEHYLARVKQKLQCSSRSALIEKALRMPSIKNRMFSQV